VANLKLVDYITHCAASALLKDSTGLLEAVSPFQTDVVAGSASFMVTDRSGRSYEVTVAGTGE